MSQELGVFKSGYGRVGYMLPYNAPGTTYKIFLANRKCTVAGIQGITTVVASDGGAVTAKLYKCVDGVAAASGTLLHAGSFDLKGTVDVRQVMTLVTDPNVLNLNAGDSVAMIVTGTTSAAIGTVQVDIEPRD